MLNDRYIYLCKQPFQESNLMPIKYLFIHIQYFITKLGKQSTAQETKTTKTRFVLAERG